MAPGTVGATPQVPPPPLNPPACNTLRTRRYINELNNDIYDVLLTVFLSSFHLLALDLGGGALAPQEPGLGLALAYLLLALHVHVRLAHAALEALARVTCGRANESWSGHGHR